MKKEKKIKSKKGNSHRRNFNNYGPIIDNELSRKLDVSHFYWIVAGLLAILVVIVKIWWNLSYSVVHDLPTRVQNVEVSLKSLEGQMRNFDTKQEK